MVLTFPAGIEEGKRTQNKTDNDDEFIDPVELSSQDDIRVTVVMDKEIKWPTDTLDDYVDDNQGKVSKGDTRLLED